MSCRRSWRCGGGPGKPVATHGLAQIEGIVGLRAGGLDSDGGRTADMRRRKTTSLTQRECDRRLTLAGAFCGRCGGEVRRPLLRTPGRLRMLLSVRGLPAGKRSTRRGVVASVVAVAACGLSLA